MTPDYGNYGIFLILGNAGSISSTEKASCIALENILLTYPKPDLSPQYYDDDHYLDPKSM